MRRPTGGGRRWLVGVGLGLCALVTLASSAQPDSAYAGKPLPATKLSAAELSIVVDAAKSCPTLTPARLAGQVMAASQFDTSPVDAIKAVGGTGTAGLTPTVWKQWAPWADASSGDTKASILALAHEMCDLVGQIRVVKITGDPWQLALAAHRVGMESVIGAGGVPAGAREYVDTVARYATWYALQPQFGGKGDADPETTPAGPQVNDVPALPVPDQYVPAIVSAGKTCGAMPATRIAAQLMATSGFDAQKLGPSGEQGIAQFLPQVWVQYVPPSAATAWSASAAIPALGTTMCALVKETAGRDKDAYALALAAFQQGNSAVTAADVAGSPGLTALVGLIRRYEVGYLKDARLAAPAPAATPTPKPTPKSSATSPAKPKATQTTKSKAPGRTNQPPIKTADGDGSGRVYGPYFIHDHGTGRCIDIPGTGAGPTEGPMNQSTCLPAADDNQEFGFVPRRTDADGYQLYWIRNVKDGHCVDPPGTGADAAETRLMENVCLDDDNQYWRLQRTITANGFQYYWLINTASGFCLDVPGDAAAGNETQLQLYPCQLGNDQDWALIERSEW